jgi:hypothetical protein
MESGGEVSLPRKFRDTARQADLDPPRILVANAVPNVAD